MLIVQPEVLGLSIGCAVSSLVPKGCHYIGRIQPPPEPRLHLFHNNMQFLFTRNDTQNPCIRINCSRASQDESAMTCALVIVLVPLVIVANAHSLTFDYHLITSNITPSVYQSTPTQNKYKLLPIFYDHPNQLISSLAATSLPG